MRRVEMMVFRGQFDFPPPFHRVEPDGRILVRMWSGFLFGTQGPRVVIQEHYSATVKSIKMRSSMGTPNVRMDEITHLTVVNLDDEGVDGRALGITVHHAWWSQANAISKDMMWRGLISTAAERWAAEDDAKLKALQDAAEAERLAAEAALPQAVDRPVDDGPDEQYEPEHEADLPYEDQTVPAASLFHSFRDDAATAVLPRIEG